MKIVMCASEVVPFAKTGGLADVAGALPQALEEEGQEIIIVMPKYKAIQELHRGKDGILCSETGKGIKVYFIENEKFFNRDGLYQDKTGDYKDNLDRFSYYSKKTLELLKQIKFKPDIIHVHDWQACLIPVFLKTLYADDAFYKKTKTLLTIHNIGYQGLFSREEFPKLGLNWDVFTMDGLEFYDKINVLKGGIAFSDAINTVSPTYSKEIMAPEQGFGLEGLLQKRKDRVFGIINGLDYNLWDPHKDEFLAQQYSAQTYQDKGINKAALLKECKLPAGDGLPLFGFVGRLAEQKGIDILEQVIERLHLLDIQLVILGTGDIKYHALLEKAAAKYHKQICLFLKFDDPLAHRIYSGCDVFLMPSRYEPCGLGQMISFKYGTPVVAHKTGGLADTVMDVNPRENEGNGFIFDHYCPEALMSAMLRAVLAYGDQKKWQSLVQRCMKLDFSWHESAKKYLNLYRMLQGK